MTPQPLTGGEGLQPSTEEALTRGPGHRRRPSPALVAACSRWLDRNGQSVLPMVHARDTLFGQNVRKALLAAHELPDGARATLVTEALVLAAQGGAGATLPASPAPSAVGPVMPSPRAELVAPWAAFLDRLRDLLDSTDDVAAFEAWAVPVDWDGAVFVVAVPNVHAVDWISGVAGQLLAELAPEVLGCSARFAFQPPLFDEQHQAVGR